MQQNTRCKVILLKSVTSTKYTVVHVNSIVNPNENLIITASKLFKIKLLPHTTPKEKGTPQSPQPQYSVCARKKEGSAW